MIVAIMQPTYLPWVGFFNLINKSDYFVFLDDVQFDKRSWQQRNKLIIDSHEKYLTVPVLSKNKYLQKLSEVKIDNSKKWQKIHLNSIKFNYGKHKYFDEFFHCIEKIYLQKNEYLINLNIKLILEITKYLGIKINHSLSSSYKIEKKGGHKIYEILKKLNALKYLSPAGSRIYLDKIREFHEKKIELEYIDYKCKSYYQKNQSKFWGQLSILDLIFNHGKASIEFF